MAGLSKRKRFNVFKRDGFRCQYCGKSPPDCILEIDHVVPSSKGGGDEMVNLLTSCFDCNRGKSDGSLDTVPASVDANLQNEMERLTQLQALNKWLISKRKAIEKEVQKVRQYWGDTFHPGNPGAFLLHERYLPSVRTFLSHLPTAELFSAIDIVAEKDRRRGIKDHWAYFCGVCWRKIKKDLGGF